MAAEALVALQMNRIDTMRNMSNRLSNEVLANQGAAAIDAELAIFSELWNRFNTTHERIFDDIPEIVDNEYHTGNAYGTANLSYTELRVRLSAARPVPEPVHEAPAVNHDQTAYFGGAHKANLLQIKLPTFQGSYDEWDSFKDLFTSLVINEDSLTGSQKMHYLKTQVKGEAAALLANLQITDDAFQPAWNLLNTRYTNPRRLLDMDIDDLLDRQPLTSHSAADLDALLLANKKSLDAIAALGIPIGELDPFLIRLTVRCLPSDLRVEWMASLGLSNEFPTYQQLHDMLKAKVRAWENSEIGAKITSTQAKSATERPASPKSFAKSAATKQVKFGNSRSATSSAPSTTTGSASYVAFTPKEKTSEPGLCPLCKEKHFVLFCPSYQKASPQNRRTIVHHYRLCFNCLGRHRYADCRTKQKCRHCDQPHHTSTHIDDGAATKPVQDAPVTEPAHSLNVLLATALVKLHSLTGSTCTARVLIDQGSELSFVTHSLIKKLDIPLHKAAVPLRGIGNVSAGHSLGSCQISLHSLHSSASITIQAHVLALLTVNLPSFTLTNKKWPHITGLQLADPDFLTSRPIDIILGAAPAAHIINAKIRKGNANDPIAQSTTLGWIIYGSVDTATSKLTAYGHHVTVDDQLQDLLSKFWYQEEPQTEFATRYTEEEEECEQHFVNTHYRQSDGRYVVRLPLKSSPSQLGDSLRAAQYALLRLRKRLEADPVYKKLYFDFLKEYEDLGHMRRVKLKDLPPNSYLSPHHGVLKEQSTTTKLRVVFNGSWKTTSGVSVNEILHVSPKIQVDISDVLIRIRCHRYLFATDVTKMFRQIAVDKEDHHLQCILWFDEDDIPTVFALTTVTYGTTSAPYLARRALLQLAEDEGNKFPKAVEPLTNTRYVDDIYGGADELAEAIQVALDTKNMCATGCFPLAKWASNSTELLSQVAPIETQVDTPRELGDTTVKVLGLTWNSTQDKFQFGYSLPEASPTTKRTILSEIARLFDPLGFLAPIIVRAKMFMQKLWLQNFDWDATLSPLLLQEWNLFRDELHQISKIQIPRWNHVKKGVSIELHGFSDASQLAMAAVVYLKVTDATGSSNISLVCAKTQVAPLKPISIPRMELNAAVLLAQLVLYVKKVLKLENVPVFMWTDSAVSLTWIRNNPARWKVYIRNRVTKIQESLPSVNWDFVPGKLNPADCASRGLSAAKLEQHSLWWSGPKWLSQSKENWPSFEIPTQTVSHLEERPGLVFTIFKADSHPLYTLLEKFSKLSPLLRTLGICLRALAKFKKVPQSSLATPLSTVDLELAKTLLIKYTQSQYYSQELKLLKDGDSVHRNHHPAKLIPYVDYNGVLRVGGRLKDSLLDDEQKKSSHFTKVITIKYTTNRSFSSENITRGTQLTLADLRRSVWIEGGRVPVRSHILRCVVCTRHRGIRAQQLMGQLPSARVRPSKAFLHTGIDYAGPVTLKTFQGRGAKTYKSWIAVFVCLATSAIHIEIVTDYSTEAFVAAFRRFTSRRGACSTLYSDCGTNFVGADATLRKEFAAGSRQLKELQYLLATDGTDWKFNPPSAPHFGGKWEAAVKSIKFHLIRTIGDSQLTYDQLATVLTQIEAVLNSRPIAPLTEDPADLTALTPGHFLIGEPLIAVPGPSLLENNTATLSRWQQLQQMFQRFLSRWSSEYLQRHQSISKWHNPQNNIKVGSLVLLTDERFPPSKWPLARVLALHPGRDGLTRVVTLKTATTELVRPIAKLCVLPVHSPNDNPVDTIVSTGENVQSRPNSLPPANAEPHQ